MTMNLQHSVTNGAAKRVSSVDVTSDSAQNPSMSVIEMLRQCCFSNLLASRVKPVHEVQHGCILTG
jgi:hypothetical protein